MVFGVGAGLEHYTRYNINFIWPLQPLSATTSATLKKDILSVGQTLQKQFNTEAGDIKNKVILLGLSVEVSSVCSLHMQSRINTAMPRIGSAWS